MTILFTFFSVILFLSIVAAIGVAMFYAFLFVVELIPAPVWFIIFVLAALITYGATTC